MAQDPNEEQNSNEEQAYPYQPSNPGDMCVESHKILNSNDICCKITRSKNSNVVIYRV